MANPADEMNMILSNVGKEHEIRGDTKNEPMDSRNSDFHNEFGVSTLNVSIIEPADRRNQQNEGFSVVLENQAPDDINNGKVFQGEGNNSRNNRTDTRVELQINRTITEIETTLKSRDKSQDNASRGKGKRQAKTKSVGRRNRRNLCDTVSRRDEGAKSIGEENTATEAKRYHLRNKMAVKRSTYQSTIKGYEAYVSGLENTKIKSEDLSFEGESPQDVMIITEDFSVDDMENVHIENNESTSDDDMDEWICGSGDDDDDDTDDDSSNVRILLNSLYHPGSN